LRRLLELQNEFKECRWRPRKKKYQRKWRMREGMPERVPVADEQYENDDFLQFKDSKTPVRDYLQFMRQKTNIKEWNSDGDVYFESQEQQLKLEKIFEKVNQGAGVMTGLKSTEKKLESSGKGEREVKDSEISERSDSVRENFPKK
jgi:hypothetical protein